MILNWDSFYAMEAANNKQELLRDHRFAEYAKNTRLWDGSIRPYSNPKVVGTCAANFIIEEEAAVCVTGCAEYAIRPCGTQALYEIKDNYLHRSGIKVGVNRPTQKPIVKSVTGKGQADNTLFRVLCLNDTGEYSPPSGVSAMASPAYGDNVSIEWLGCKPYRLQALLRQSMTNKSEIGKNENQWVTVGDYESLLANFEWTPESWQLTSDGYDPASFCDPPKLECFFVTADGYFVAWDKTLLYVSERHDPSKFPRRNIKSFGAQILDIVGARSALYISTSKGLFVARIEPSPEGASISISKTYENHKPIKGTLGVHNSGALYATEFGVFSIDESGRQPQNITGEFLHEDEFAREFLPESAAVQRGIYYATNKEISWLYDFPGTSGGQGNFGKLVYIDRLGDKQVAASDGHLYYFNNQSVLAFDRGEGYLEATWESSPKKLPVRTALSRYKVTGDNLEGVVLTVTIDGKESVLTDIKNERVCTLPQCCTGFIVSIKVYIPAKAEKTVIEQIQLASSVSEILRT